MISIPSMHIVPEEQFKEFKDRNIVFSSKEEAD